MMGVTQRLPPMSRALLILTAAVSFTLSVCIDAADDPVLDRFASYLESLRAQAGIPGLAASIVGPADVIPRGVWERGFGRQNIDRSSLVSWDTPFHLDGGTQLVTAALVLRCAEEKQLSLDDPVSRFIPDAPEPRATLRQLLSHTSMQVDGLVFSHRPDRLDPLASAVATCRGEPFRRAVADLLERDGMYASVPGPDASALSPSESFSQSTIDRYRSVMSRLAIGYTVSGQRTATTASYSATTLTPSKGLITTVHDLTQFDLDLKKNRGYLLPESIELAWTAPVGRDGRRLPHGLGWFVQSYSGETVVWQFGLGNASSSMIVTVPARGLTMILLANSSGLAKGFNLTAGDVTVSPFAKAFLGTFLR
jgi:CubicO group peptidase (beta-lactamase class C family)